MKTSIIYTTLLTPLIAASYAPFSVSPLTTHEPNGDPDGQVNYYHINFTVSSTNDASGSTSAICTKTWSDNAWTQPQAYSVNVPSGSWMACSPSTYSFQLYPYFSIGNFTLGVQQNFTDASNGTQTLASGSTQITNTTSTSPSLTCTINPNTVTYVQHASGDCSLPNTTTSSSSKDSSPSGGPPQISIPITTSAPAPGPCAATTVNTTFLVSADLSSSPPNSTLYVAGSIPALGAWDPDHAIELSPTSSTGSSSSSTGWPTFSGAVDMAAGTYVEYKYLMKDATGDVAWECCENRVYTVPAGTCGEGEAGGDPDTYRG